MSFIGFNIYGLTPIANSPTYLAPSSVSKTSFIRLSSFAVAFIIFHL